ncbi:hypothetical protein [Rariglobus hedericola]|uniref:Uncharacterized protein n=1 Tax=Rariglobus hedericola TaxID=2597822 RepID=A0A556QPH5_9BACT|nr:hypothetical protein [Rariglobus hedericola]TSJ78536.1 hypothetical protein FPL22_04345 [Rariglobus hedericola]
MTSHPTQIFLHNPQALRAEFRLDDARLLLWWSPGAGHDNDALERNYSNRDDHLDVFERIVLEDTPLDSFRSCDYDAYRVHLRYAGRDIELATVPDVPVVLLTARRGNLCVRFKSARHDRLLAANARSWAVRHEEGGRTFEFAACVGEGGGGFRHQPIFESGRAIHGRVELAEGQTLLIGVGMEGKDIAGRLDDLAARSLAEINTATDENVAKDLTEGTPVFRSAPDLDRLYEQTRRSLHGAIDDSGALRAALKDIYYLIWVRDGAFCFNSQAAAGWLHKHVAWCRYLLANPLVIGAEEPALPPGRTYGQLVAQRFGKLEEDGPYYVVWSVFTAWVQTGDPTLVTPAHLALLEETVRWTETYAFDEGRGLFRERLVDESPFIGSRDDGWDAATGDLQREGGMRFQGRQIRWAYSAYMNLLMFGTYSMLAALPSATLAAEYRAKAARLWRQLAAFLPSEGLPPAGELVLDDGSCVLAPPYIPKTACYIWAFALPGLAPLPNIDAVRLNLLRDVTARPRGHWLNAITALIAAVDPLVCDEQELIRAIHYIAAQGQRSGKYLPMPGTLPEKYDAPEGIPYDDIRPQAFSQSSYLAACTSLGVRRLPFGLAVRPTRFMEKLSAYAWGESRIDFVFGANHEGVCIDGFPLVGSLQLPAESLSPGRVVVSVGSLPASPVLARSNLALHRAIAESDAVCYDLESFGFGELVFTRRLRSLSLSPIEGSEHPESNVAIAWTEESGLHVARFEGVGRFRATAILV